MISGWTILLILLSIQVAAVTIYMFAHFWAYIPVYRSSRIVFPTLLIIEIIGQIELWKIVYAEITDELNLHWPNLILNLVVFCYLLLFGFYGVCVYLYGKNFLFRLQFRNKSMFGPMMTFKAKDASIILLKYWIKKSDKEKSTIVHQIDANLKKSIIPFLNEELLNANNRKISEKNTFFSNYDEYSIELGATNFEESWSFVVVGDLHAGGNQIEPLISTLSKYYAQSKFVLSLGDSVSDAQQKSHWKTFLTQLQPLLYQMPILAIPGNHDGYMKKRFENWKRIFEQDFPQSELGGYHSIQCGQIYFILLDNYNGSHQYTYLSKEQTVWLDEELKKASDISEIRYIILGMHHPPFSTGEAGCDPILGELFESRVKQFPKISLILAGHCHLYQRFEVKSEHSNVNYIVTGGGGGVLDQWITKKWTKRPYFWNSNGHLENVQFDLNIAKKHKLRNDQFVKQYHKKSIIQNHFLFITVDKNQIYISVRTWQNDEIESFSIPTIAL